LTEIPKIVLNINMAKKKKIKRTSTRHFFYKTRPGFYSLVGISAILAFSILKMYSIPEKGVLGKEDRGNQNSESRGKEEQKREEKKEEIRQELQVEPNKVKLKYESKNGSVERKLEIEHEDADIEDEKEEEIEDKIEVEFEEEHKTDIATESPDVTIKKNKVKARTGFPLSIDVATNQLIVTRPDGTTKAVTVLPDAAVQNFMSHKKVNLINVQPPDTGTDSADTNPDTNASSSATNTETTQVKLIEKDDQLVYEIKGKKKLKVFGIFPVSADTTGYVSAETGEVVSQEEPLLTKFLNILSL